MRLRLICIVLFIVGGVQTAQAAEETRSVANAFMKCARIAGDAQRLSCYDRLATELIELGISNMEVGPGPGAAAPATPATGDQPAPVAMNAPAPTTAGQPAAAPPEAPPPSVGQGAAAVATTEAGFGLERVEDSKRGEVKEIRSRYVGEFTGWDGKTVFRLENGQVWQQNESGRMSWKATSPMITIKRGFMGSYVLRVEGVNKTVRVKRIE
jgi:hypothetical protein